MGAARALTAGRGAAIIAAPAAAGAERTLIMPPLVAAALATSAAAVAARWLRREWRRVNAELDRAEAAAKVPKGGEVPTLRRDPRSGVWRPS